MSSIPNDSSPRMRTIRAAHMDILRHDPDSALTLGALRRLTADGKIHSVRIGNKFLIDMASLEEYLLRGDSCG